MERFQFIKEIACKYFLLIIFSLFNVYIYPLILLNKDINKTLRNKEN